MYPEFLFLSNPPSQYQQNVNLIWKKSRYQTRIKQHHQQQFQKLDSDNRFIDSPLTENSYEKIYEIKKQLMKMDSFDTVVIAPLRKSLQTCYQIFKGQNFQSANQKMHFYIEPLLADRLNSTHAIGNFSETHDKQEYTQFKKLFGNLQILNKSQWIYDIMPKRIKNQLPNNIGLIAGEEYLKLMKSNADKYQLKEIQNKLQFVQRLQQLKQSLEHYREASGSGKPVLIIASSQVLNLLACTDFHQNGDPVNPLRMECGQVDKVCLNIGGLDILRSLDFESILPFCR